MSELAQQTFVADETSLVELGGCFASLVGEQVLVSLRGDLGAGKTTFVRGLLRGAGYQANVKSPTFSLVETYELARGKVYHFDFYRLQDPEELEYIGIRDYLHEKALCLIEWPEKAAGFLPTADLEIMIEKVEQGRRVHLQIRTEHGRAVFDGSRLEACMADRVDELITKGERRKDQV